MPQRRPWHVIGKIFLILGAAFSAAAVLFFVLFIAFDGDAAFTFSILALAFFINGAVWLILGACFYMYAKRASAKLEYLKKVGLSYDAEIVRMIPVGYVRIGGFLTTYVECTYRNGDGKTCLVKSGSFLLDRICGKEELNAKVYVSNDNPKIYSVEVLAVSLTNLRVDHDYR